MINNKYELFFNLPNEMKSVYEKRYIAEKYDILVNEENFIFVRKINDETTSLRHEQEIINFIVETVKRQVPKDGIFHMDLSKEMSNILERVAEVEEINFVTDRYIPWAIRVAITRAIKLL